MHSDDKMQDDLFLSRSLMYKRKNDSFSIVKTKKYSITMRFECPSFHFKQFFLIKTYYFFNQFLMYFRCRWQSKKTLSFFPESLQHSLFADLKLIAVCVMKMECVGFVTFSLFSSKKGQRSLIRVDTMTKSSGGKSWKKSFDNLLKENRRTINICAVQEDGKNEMKMFDIAFLLYFRTVVNHLLDVWYQNRFFRILSVEMLLIKNA